MPYTITWEDRGVVWTYSGIVTGAELLESNQEIYGDERFDKMAYQIVDLTRVVGFEASPEEMLVVAANDRAAARTNPRVRIGVAATDEVARDMSALYEQEIARTTWEQRVFERVEDARKWATGLDDGNGDPPSDDL